MGDRIVVTWAGNGLNWDQAKGLMQSPGFRAVCNFPGQVGVCEGQPVVREVTHEEWLRLIGKLRGRRWLDLLE